MNRAGFSGGLRRDPAAPVTQDRADSQHSQRPRVRKLFRFILWMVFSVHSHHVSARPERDLRVLIVDGFNNHDWEATSRAIRSILVQDGGFVVEVSTVPDSRDEAWIQWNPPFRNYDLVVQNTNDIDGAGAWPASAQKSLEQYVSGGGGLLVFHSANNAFPDWLEYNKMIGLGWRDKDFGPSVVIHGGKPQVIPAGVGENTDHGERVDARITRLGDHPIHRGLPRTWMAADLEIYRYARGPMQNLTVLSYARDPMTGVHFPTEWVVGYGRGRVYNSTFGHDWYGGKGEPPGIRCMGFRTILCRAARWLAGADVPQDVPVGFPSSDRTSFSNS